MKNLYIYKYNRKFEKKLCGIIQVEITECLQKIQQTLSAKHKQPIFLEHE